MPAHAPRSWRDGASPLERALIRALAERYPSPDPTDDFDLWTTAYASAMGEVYAAYGDDLDVAALYADSLMNLTPWALWDLSTGGPADGARTLEVKRGAGVCAGASTGDVSPGPAALLHPPDGDVAACRNRRSTRPTRCAG